MKSSDLIPIRDGISFRRLADVGVFSVDHVEVAAGSREFEIVHYECDEVWYVLEGELEAIVDSRTFVVGPGDCVLVPRGTPHGSHNATDRVVKLLVINDPPWRPEHDHEPA